MRRLRDKPATIAESRKNVSKLARDRIQQDLIDRYERFRRSSSLLPADLAAKLSAPHLVSVSEEWLTGHYRTLVVGQETRGWGLASEFHGRPESKCTRCPFRELGSFSEFIAREDSIQALVHAYEVFDFGRNQNINSPFWDAFRELTAGLGDGGSRSVLWGRGGADGL